MFKAEGMFRSGWPSKLTFCFCFLWSAFSSIEIRWAHPRDRDSMDATSHGWPLWCLYGHKILFLKTPLGSLSWDPVSVRRARAVAPLGEARIPPRCFAVSNKNVPQQGIRIGTVSELNKSEPMDERLLQKSTLFWAIGKNMVALRPRISPIPKNACAAFLKTKGGTIIRRPTSLEATKDAVLAP